MIYGIGIDVIEPARVARVLDKFGDRFVNRVLTPRERPGYARTAQPVLFLANRFSAKEAFSKAMGTGFRYPVTRDSSERSLPDAPDLVNLARLQQAMEELATYLSCVAMELSARLDWKMERDAASGR